MHDRPVGSAAGFGRYHQRLPRQQRQTTVDRRHTGQRFDFLAAGRFGLLVAMRTFGWKIVQASATPVTSRLANLARLAADQLQEPFEEPLRPSLSIALGTVQLDRRYAQPLCRCQNRQLSGTRL
jgi:hypothetical protein